MQKLLHHFVREGFSMKRIVMATILACVLSGVALAGEIPIGGFAPPPPSPTQPTSITATVVLTLLSLLR